MQRVKTKAEIMGWELKQISSQHCRAASVPEHCVGFVEKLASRRETTICLHWERGVVGREWKVEEKRDGEKKMGWISSRLCRDRKKSC